ncbi:MAG: GrpB family protein [Dehalococcoidia bacterium]|nr:GrpB family protein [Dehalococcoidia bacterium]MCB9485730.1 GrpB family protein [Thermoflexaceae bacterium]
MPGPSRPVVLVPYNFTWPGSFAGLRDEIAGACGDLLAGIEHVGSTAVPGLAAKPVIDLMPILRRFEDGPACAEALGPLGYDYLGEYGIPGRQFFTKNEARTGTRIANVHMYERGHDEAIAHLAFRDYLRAHDDWRDRYESLKRELAARFPGDVEAYAEAKTEFVKEVVALGLAEAGSGHLYRRAR